MLTTVDGLPLLLPTPMTMRRLSDRRLRVEPGVSIVARALLSAMPKIDAECEIHPGLVLKRSDTTLGSGAYRLSVRANASGATRIEAVADDAPGFRSAMATVVQLCRACDEGVPELEIVDRPDFATRGVMLDISRDRVPTMEHLRETIDMLAELKYNQLQLYTEHTFAYAGHEEVWADASPISPSEARGLDAYAAARGIEMVPNQNCFGHLASWLKRPRYQPISEIEGDGVWKFLHWERRGAFSLNPMHSGSGAFIADLLGQLLPCFQSSMVNIGCDETFDVGWGRSKAEAERRAAASGCVPGTPEHDSAMSRARAELYFEFVAEIARICRARGKTPMMWADIALSHPELLHLMPKEMIGLAWWYEPTDKFASWVKVLREHGHRAWVCPGTSSWRSFTGRSTERRGNLADAAEQGLRAGADGYLVCDWGDVGHRQTWPISLMGLAHGAEAAWNAARARTFDARAAALHAFGDASGELGRWMEALGDADLHIRQRVRLTNATALFNDLHPPVPAAIAPGQRCINAPVEEWMLAKRNLEVLAGRFPPGLDGLIARELRHTLDVGLFAADHAVAHRSAGDGLMHVKPELQARAESVLREHEALWVVRSRVGGMAHASSFYQSVMDGLS